MVFGLLKSLSMYHINIYSNFEYPFMHLHPDSLYCLDELLKINSLRVIEISK